MRRFLCIAILALLAGSCTTNQEEQITLKPNQGFKLIPATERNNIFTQILKEKGEFEWNWTTDRLLYSALTDNNDGMLVVGYQPEGFQEGDEINVQQGAWVNAKENLIADIMATYERYGFAKTRKDAISAEHKRHPFFKVKVEMIELVTVIRQSNYFRYAEPDTYFYTQNGGNSGNQKVASAGCGAPETSPIGNDYLKASDNTYYSWHHTKNGIVAAQANGNKGKGIKIGMIDTGIYSTQYYLNGGFKLGFSSGRNYYRYGTFTPKWNTRPDGIYDDCGHGTSMAGLIAAPRTTGGSVSGVAYQADFYAVRGTNDVLLDRGDEKDGVMEAVDLLADKNVNIVSMSLGHPFTIYRIRDAIRDAYNKKGVMFICAAGTSAEFVLDDLGVVIFPANMSETVAVTGVIDQYTLKAGGRCHYGRKVDFAVTMERYGNKDRTVLSLRRTSATPDYSGGSSCATATFAGIAGLVWSENRSQSRNQVLQHLINNSERRNSRDRRYGWGRVNVYDAVRAAR